MEDATKGTNLFYIGGEWRQKPEALSGKSQTTGSVCEHQWDYEPKGFFSGVKTRTCKVCGAVETAATPY